jgi:hypothetical protein
VITGTYPNYSIDFTKLIVAKGTLMGADTPEATAETGNKVAIDWIDNSGNGDAEATDNALASDHQLRQKGRQNRHHLKRPGVMNYLKSLSLHHGSATLCMCICHSSRMKQMPWRTVLSLVL